MPHRRGEPVVVQGIGGPISLGFISAMQLRRCMRHGCRMYAVTTIGDGDEPYLDDHIVLREFADVFPDESPHPSER